MCEQHIWTCPFLHSLIQAQETLSKRKAVCKLGWSWHITTAHLGFLGRGLPSRRNVHVPIHSQDPTPPPQSTRCKGKAENKVVLSIPGFWLALVSFFHFWPRRDLGANGSEVLPMCKLCFSDLSATERFGRAVFWKELQFSCICNAPCRDHQKQRIIK